MPPYASFVGHRWIQTGATAWKRSIRVKAVDYLARVTWKFDKWLENNRAPLLCPFKLCASFRSNRWIQNEIIVRKRSIWVKIVDLSAHVHSESDTWIRKPIEHIFHVTVSFVHYLICICKLKLEAESGNAQFGWESSIFSPVWPWKLEDDLQNYRAPFLHYIELCASCCRDMCIKTWVTVRKGPNLCLWPWPFAWTSRQSMVISPENCMMIRCRKQSEQGKSEEFDGCDCPSNPTHMGFKSL